jgi:hypothetical protein
MKILATIKGQPIHQSPDGSVTFVGEASIDADGSPRAYGPNNSGLDYTANAGKPGNWWALVTDPDGDPLVQGANDPAPGYYISTTSLTFPDFSTTDPRHYVDSEVCPFIVVPGILASRATGIVLGCRGELADLRGNAIIPVVVADLGPDSHLGEMSIAAAKILGINPDARRGGCDQRVFQYQFWPGEAAPGFQLQRL